ncbi:MAG: hypothetical protein QM778_36965 [Myxococcales bacterium]
MATQSGLFFAHYEHRRRLPQPVQWSNPDLPEEENGGWVGGQLAEPKYQAFRHDLLIASFHPGHRAKWTAHELCHALVGFAYHPEASMLFHALGAWLAELLPVALWYFFDEAGLQKCERHRGQGPLFQGHCAACEEIALLGPAPWSKSAERFMREGRAFVKRELGAIRRAIKSGQPHGTRFATIDLASDGLAYARAHGARLRAPEMERFVAQFFGRHQGHHDSLEALENRVLEVCSALTENTKLTPWRSSRWDYAAQDVGYRLLTVRAQFEGALANELDKVIDALARRRTEAGLEQAAQGYRALRASLGRRAPKLVGLAPVEELFAVGYELPLELGHDVEQLGEGIVSACPNTRDALGKQFAATCLAFSREDVPERSPIGRRFARFVGKTRGGPLADLATIEAAITHVGPRDQITQTLPFEEGVTDHVRLAAGAEVVRMDHDVLGISGAEARRVPRLAEPRFLGVLRSGAQDVDLLELPAAVGRALAELGGDTVARVQLGMDDAGFHELLATGLLVPERYVI